MNSRRPLLTAAALGFALLDTRWQTAGYVLSDPTGGP